MVILVQDEVKRPIDPSARSVHTSRIPHDKSTLAMTFPPGASGGGGQLLIPDSTDNRRRRRLRERTAGRRSTQGRKYWDAQQHSAPRVGPGLATRRDPKLWPRPAGRRQRLRDRTLGIPMASGCSGPPNSSAVPWSSTGRSTNGISTPLAIPTRTTTSYSPRAPSTSRSGQPDPTRTTADPLARTRYFAARGSFRRTGAWSGRIGH